MSKAQDDKKRNYFKDGIRIIDFILVVDVDIIQNAEHVKQVVYFLHWLHDRGVDVEMHPGIVTNCIFIKLHMIDVAIRHYAEIYNVDLTNTGHNYNIKEQTLFRCIPVEEDTFIRQNNNPTNMERILIISQLLNDAKFGDEDSSIGMDKLIKLGVLKTAYPLHDPEKEVLEKTWANFTHSLFREQPLNLVDKYFGAEVAFYFAWFGFYIKMLVPAAIFGIIVFLISVLHLVLSKINFVRDICSSDLPLCTLCDVNDRQCKFTPLKNYCFMSKATYLFDNFAILIIAIFMSFWATMFLQLWIRRQNVLKIRWAVEFEESDTTLRRGYVEKLKKMQKNTVDFEKMEQPQAIVVLQYIISYGVTLLLLGLVVIVLFGIIVYKMYLRSFCKSTTNIVFSQMPMLIPIIAGCLLSTIFVKLFGMIYAPMSIWLTNVENPRTQSEFDDLVVYKRFILGFLNNCVPLIYMAFIKGESFTIPKPYASFGDLFIKDTCRPVNCVFDIAMLLLFYMLFKSMIGNILTLCIPPLLKKYSKKSEIVLPQWEEEYYLEPTNRYLLTTEFMELIMQYCFLSLFGCTFPLAAVCALVNNVMEIRLDAYKLVTRFRRPIPRKTCGIGPWNLILQYITFVGMASSAFVMAFTSDVVSRELYRNKHGSLKGYVNFTLAQFDVKTFELDYMDYNNISTCYYTAFRHPPKHENEYRLTVYFWFEFGIRLACVALFEHFIFLFNWLLSYAIPDVPRSVKKQLRYAMKNDREERIHELHVQMQHSQETTKLKNQ